MNIVKKIKLLRIVNEITNNIDEVNIDNLIGYKESIHPDEYQEELNGYVNFLFNLWDDGFKLINIDYGDDCFLVDSVVKEIEKQMKQRLDYLCSEEYLGL